MGVKSGPELDTLLAPGAILNGALPTLGAVPDLGEHNDAIRAEFSGD